MQKWLKIVTIIVFIVVDIIGAILAGVSIGGGKNFVLKSAHFVNIQLIQACLPIYSP